MRAIQSRLKALEAELGLNADSLRGILDLEPGADPLQALKGKVVGMYLFVDAVTDGAVFLGRVDSVGRASIRTIGRPHATH